MAMTAYLTLIQWGYFFFLPFYEYNSLGAFLKYKKAALQAGLLASNFHGREMFEFLHSNTT